MKQLPTYSLSAVASGEQVEQTHEDAQSHHPGLQTDKQYIVYLMLSDSYLKYFIK